MYPALLAIDALVDSRAEHFLKYVRTAVFFVRVRPLPLTPLCSSVISTIPRCPPTSVVTHPALVLMICPREIVLRSPVVVTNYDTGGYAMHRT